MKEFRHFIFFVVFIVSAVTDLTMKLCFFVLFCVDEKFFVGMSSSDYECVVPANIF
jgi:hypothetical protein